jgi:hypothetical protein
MHVRDQHKWLRAKRIVTAMLALASLASMGGLEGTGEVPFISWLLLACTMLGVWNITKHYGRGL